MCMFISIKDMEDIKALRTALDDAAKLLEAMPGGECSGITIENKESKERAYEIKANFRRSVESNKISMD